MFQFIKKRQKRRAQDRFIKKKLNKKIRERPRSDMVFQAKKKLKKKILLISGISVGIAIIILGIIAWQSFFYSENQIIRSVEISSGSLSWHSDDLLFEMISQDVVGTSRRANSWFGIDSLIEKRTDYSSLINTIELLTFEQGTTVVNVVWNTPSILFRLPSDRWYGSYQQDLFDVDPQDGIATSTRIVDLPRYTETFDSIDGIFRSLSENELTEILESIDIALGKEAISERIYLPGGKKLFLGYDSKRRYFHLTKDLQTQIDKLISVREYYDDYENISIIDLGSTDNIIVK